MNTVTLHFRAEGQKLIPLDGIYKYASNTVEYIRAVVDLGDDWTDFDVVRAAWFTDYDCIVTVLDQNGVCVIPAEVLNKRAEVCVNLFGCDVEEDELVDRLTTYPIKAVLIDANARVCGSETAPITPSQFEQFIAIVEDLVHTVRDIDRAELNPDYTLTIYYTDGTSDTVGPIRGEQGPVGPTGNGISKIEKIGTAGLVDTYRITYTNGQTYEYTVTNGAQGPQGNGIVSIYKSGESGAVKTYTILFTDGNTFEYNVTDGEVTFATLEQLMPKDTASGSIASFPDGQAVFPLQSCVVDIDPIQDLHGYANPWPAGGGKNKWSFDAEYTPSGYAYLVYMQPFSLPAGTYTFSCIPNISTDTVVLFGYHADETRTEMARLSKGTERKSQTFTLTQDVVSFLFVSNSGGTISQIQLESGSSMTSYEPYANICPISGWTEANLTVCGKNMFDKAHANLVSKKYIDSSIIDSGSGRTLAYIPCKPNTKYTLSRTRYDANTRFVACYTKTIPDTGVAVYGRVGADNSGTVGEKLSITVTTGADAQYLVCWVGWNSSLLQDELDSLQIELGQTATAYEAYNGTDYTIPLGQTVYGGTVDPVSGVLTIDHAIITLNGTQNPSLTNWRANSNGVGWLYPYSLTQNKVTLANTVPSLICDSLPTQKYDSLYGQTVGVGVFNSTSYGLVVWFPDPTLTTTALINAYLSNNPLQVCYELATPITIQLTPQQIATLYGTNNIFADSGAVAVRYIADIGLYIDKKTA